MNLLFHQAALGDFVLTWPLLRAMQGPTCVIARWSLAQLASDVFEHVDAADIELREFGRLFDARGPSALGPFARGLFDRAQRIVSFVSSGQDAWAANVRLLAPQAELITLTPRPPATHTGHVTAYYASCLSLEPGAPAPRPGERVIVHPGSGGEEKCWPRERFESLILALRGQGRTVTPLLGEVEVERWPRATITHWVDGLDARVCDTVFELHEALRPGGVYVGNDAGPTHLAAQLGLTTLALFGPTDPAVWSPVGPSVRVLAPPSPRGMEWLDVDTVAAALG